MKAKSILSVLAVAGLVVASQSALAATITTTYAGGANFGTGGVGYYNGQVAPNPGTTPLGTYNGATLTGVGIGGDSFTSSDHTYNFSQTGQFNTWCVDIYHWLRSGAFTYNVGSKTDLAASLDGLRSNSGTQRVNDLQRLANQVYLGVDTKDESAAFQLAVWSITYGTAANYQISATANTGFWVGSTTAVQSYVTMANGWLANLGTATKTATYHLDYLYDNSQVQGNTSPNTQDMVVFTKVTAGECRDCGDIPEPASLSLLGIGLMGLGYIRRKSAKAVRT